MNGATSLPPSQAYVTNITQQPSVAPQQSVNYYVTEAAYDDYQHSLKDLKRVVKAVSKGELDQIQVNEQGHFYKEISSSWIPPVANIYKMATTFLGFLFPNSFTALNKEPIHPVLNRAVTVINQVHQQIQQNPKHLQAQTLDSNCIRLAAKLSQESEKTIAAWNKICQENSFSALAVQYPDESTHSAKLIGQTAHAIKLEKFLEMTQKQPRLVPSYDQNFAPNGHTCVIETIGPHLDDNKQVVLDAKTRSKIESIQNKLYQGQINRLGAELASDGTQTGVFALDRFWAWIRETVRIVPKEEGKPASEFTYNKIMAMAAINNVNGIAGAVMLPFKKDPSGEIKIALILNSRYALGGQLCFELPRGGTSSTDATGEETAKKETLEETGFMIDKGELLGQVSPDSGMIGHINMIYMGEITGETTPKREKTESIEGTYFFSVQEILDGIANGSLTIKTEQGPLSYPLHDGFTLSAVALALAKGKLKA